MIALNREGNAMRKIALISALLALAIPAAASAEPLPEGKAVEFLALAKTHWERMLPGREPPCPSTIRFMGDAEWRALAAEHRFAPDETAAADTWGCRIWVRRSFWRSYPAGAHATRVLCNIIAHEYGHNIGIGHTPNYPLMMHSGYAEECRMAAGESAALAQNPHLPRTQRLYRRGARMVDRLDRLHLERRCRARARSVNRCHRTRDRLLGVRRAIRELEGALPRAARFRGESRWP